MSELFYINEDGNNVHTAQFLKNRGSCCKTNCLHCPYGTTLKNLGLQFRQLELNDLAEANLIIKENTPQNEETLGQSLLQEAFGKSKKTEVTKFNFKDFYFVLLKEQKAGLVKKGRLQLKELFLKNYFKNQDLDLDTVTSFFNS